MPELEEQLRELGEASSHAERRPDADAWSDVRDRLGEPVVSVVPVVPVGRSRRGRLMAVAAAVAAIALAGASLVAGSRRGADRFAGVELSGSFRWLPVPAPDGFRPNRASDNVPDGPIAGRIIVVRSTVGDLTAITLYSRDGPTDPTSGGLTAALSVRGFPAVLQPFDDDTTSLEWSDTVVTLQLIVAGARATDRSFLLDIASRVTRPGPTSADVALESVPDGFDVRFVGSEDRLGPGGGWKLGYETDDGRGFQLELTVGGLTAEQLAAIYDYEPVTVAGRSGYLGVGGPGAFPVADPAHRTLLIDLTNGVHLVLNSLDLTRQELLDIGASLRPVDDDSWHTVANGAPESYLNTATTSARQDPPSTASSP